MIWNNIQLSEALGIKIQFDFQAISFEFNSQEVKAGAIFIALPGENGDGHSYINDAIKREAVAIIASHIPENVIEKDKIILVKDTKEALLNLAKYKRINSKAKFIGVTGSNGKTSTKEMIYAVLAGFGQAHKNVGNFNNDLGVPITLARMPDDTEYAVIEMGMNHPGEIRILSELTKPDVAVITTIAAVHLEFFDSVLGIVDEKSEIFAGNENMTAILNYNNEHYTRLRDNAKKFGIKNILEFGLDTTLTKVTNYVIHGDNMEISAMINNVQYTYKLPVSGKHHIGNSLSAILVAYALNLDLNKASSNISQMYVEEGRGRIYTINYNSKKITLLDESYNANPDSTRATIIALHDKFPKNRKVIILGDMKELGTQHEVEFHKGLLPTILDSKINLVVLVGKLMKNLHDILPNEIKGPHFDTYSDLINSNFEFFQENDVVLLKSSKSVKLSYVVKHLTQFRDVPCFTN